MTATRWWLAFALLGLMTASSAVAGPTSPQAPIQSGPRILSCATDPDPVGCLAECVLYDPEGITRCLAMCWVVDYTLTLGHEVTVTPSGSGWGSDTESQTSGYYELVDSGSWTYRFTGSMPCAE